MTMRWFGLGVSIHNFIPGTTDISELSRAASFTSPDIHDGDQVVRVLLSYWLSTIPIANDLFGSNYIVLPRGVVAWFEPNPDAPSDPTSTTPNEALFGDALARMTVDWEPVPFDDAGTPSTRYVAHSPGMLSASAKRDIVDKDTATIHVGLGTLNIGPDSPNAIDPEFSGYVYLNYLVNRR